MAWARGSIARMCHCSISKCHVPLNFIILTFLDLDDLLQQAEAQTRTLADVCRFAQQLSRDRDALLEIFTKTMVDVLRVEGEHYIDRYILSERGDYAAFAYKKAQHDLAAEASSSQVPVSGDGLDDDEDDDDDDGPALPFGTGPPQPQAVYVDLEKVTVTPKAKRRREIPADSTDAQAGPSRLLASSPFKAPSATQERAAGPSNPASKKRVEPEESSPPVAGPSRPSRSPRKAKPSDRRVESPASSSHHRPAPPV